MIGDFQGNLKVYRGIGFWAAALYFLFLGTLVSGFSRAASSVLTHPHTKLNRFVVHRLSLSLIRVLDSLKPSLSQFSFNGAFLAYHPKVIADSYKSSILNYSTITRNFNRKEEGDRKSGDKRN